MPWVLRVILAVKFKQWSLYSSIIIININIGTQVEASALALETRVTMALMVRSIVLEKANWYCPGCRRWQLGLVQVSELFRRSVLEYLWGTKRKKKVMFRGMVVVWLQIESLSGTCLPSDSSKYTPGANPEGGPHPPSCMVVCRTHNVAPQDFITQPAG